MWTQCIYVSTRLYASVSSIPTSTSILELAVARLASLSAISFPLIHTWLGSQRNVISLLYLLTNSITFERRLGILVLLPDTRACKQLYESLNILINVINALKRDNFTDANSVANIVTLSFVLSLCSMYNSLTQNAAAALGCSVI